jgi:hypothetical protein
LQETNLTPEGLKRRLLPNRFSLLATFDVDGQIYAQPLYVPEVKIADGTYHNLLYVATATNHVYAFDVDDFFKRDPLLRVYLGTPVGADFLNGTFNVIYPNVGITSTPVIDLSTNTIYLVAKIAFYTNGSVRKLQDQIFALDLATLAVKDSAVVGQSVIDPTGAVISNFTFDSKMHKNRPGLLLLKNRVYVAYGAFNHENIPGGIHGWIFSFDAHNLGGPSVVFNTSPDYSYAGVWQSGNGLASDGSYIYLNTGNGGLLGETFKSAQLGDSVLKLSADLRLVQSYTPPNVKCLDTCDLDLGSSGPVLFPGSEVLLTGAKEGIFYVFSRTDISKLSQCAFRAAGQPNFLNQIPYCSSNPNSSKSSAPGIASSGCEVPNPFNSCTEGGRFWGSVVSQYSHIHSAPVVLQTGPGQYQVYVWPEENPLKMFKYSGGTLSHEPTIAQGADVQAPPESMPGGVMSLSADPQGKNAILWGTVPKDCTQPAANCSYAVRNNSDGAENATVPGRFVAFDANTLQELWSDLDVGFFAKFTPPTIADGKVFVANFGSSAPADTSCGFAYGAPPSGPRSCGHVRVYGMAPPFNTARELIGWPYVQIDPGQLGPPAPRRPEQ